MVVIQGPCSVLKLPIVTRHPWRDCGKAEHVGTSEQDMDRNVSLGLPIKNTFIDLDDNQVEEGAKRVHPSGVSTWCVGRFAANLPPRDVTSKAADAPITPITPIVQSPAGLATPWTTRAGDAIAMSSYFGVPSLQPTAEDDSEDLTKEDDEDDEGFVVVRSASTPSTARSICGTPDFFSGFSPDLSSTMLDTSVTKAQTDLTNLCVLEPDSRLRPISGETSATRTEPEVMRPTEIMARFDRSTGAPMGIDVDHRDVGALLVCNIFGGCAQAWNRQHPELEVKVGDRIVEVNGVSGHPCALINECWKDQVLHVRIRRDAPALSREISCKSSGTSSTAMSSAPTLLSGSSTATSSGATSGYMPPVSRLTGRDPAPGGAGGSSSAVCSSRKHRGGCRYQDASRRSPKAAHSDNALAAQQANADVARAGNALPRGGRTSVLQARAALASARRDAENPAACQTCRHWEQKGWCRYQEKCRFAHAVDMPGAGVTMAMASRSSEPTPSLRR